MDDHPKSLLFHCDLMITSWQQLMRVAPFWLYDVKVRFSFLLYNLWLIYGLSHQFLRQFFQNKYYGHLFEQGHSLDIFHSYHMKWQYFLRFVLLFVDHQLHHYWPKFRLKITSPKNIYSEILPPKATHNWSHNIYLVISIDSLGKYWANPKAPFDLGTIVIFSNGEAPSKNHEATACPHSW